MFFYGIDRYFILFVIPAMIFSLVMQGLVKGTYRKMSRIQNGRRLTGAEAAARVLSYYEINGVAIEGVRGTLSDHYDPRDKVIRLSQGVFAQSTVAAVGIACHEAGHAAQHAKGYVPVKLRNALLPVCNVGSALGLPLVFLGYITSFEPLVTVGLALFALITLFQLVTLPVEFNASRRALRVIDEQGLLEGEEYKGARSVLRAAAMTYVAALVVSIANLLRLLLRFRSRN
ncbi:MAG: zinc metallopeptidase [Oscillospiraceae bacterium]|jgi:Zn-dependent membrane protease YugP|nr:zinc metallopeptidase [Oscillospiraceae bacterium]